MPFSVFLVQYIIMALTHLMMGSIEDKIVGPWDPSVPQVLKRWILITLERDPNIVQIERGLANQNSIGPRIITKFGVSLLEFLHLGHMYEVQIKFETNIEFSFFWSNIEWALCAIEAEFGDANCWSNFKYFLVWGLSGDWLGQVALDPLMGNGILTFLVLIVVKKVN
ncbi:hypothetical protein ACJX0J_037740 [Zea mays]